MAARRKAVPAAPNAIARETQRPAEDGVGTRLLLEEMRITPLEGTLQCARRRELTAVAPVPKAGADGDTIGARPNWATIAASLEQLLARVPAKRGKPGSTGERGATRLSVGETLTLSDLFRPCRSLGRGSDKIRTGKAVGQATQVVPGTSL